MSDAMRWSITLIGLALALAGGVGVFLPRGERWAILLPLIAGAGVGIASLALGTPDMNDSTSSQAFERVFLWSSIAGFITVCLGLVAVWFRARPSIPVS
jgi:NhaP-type Na+/H+ or K+/H+ antiporter